MFYFYKITDKPLSTKHMQLNLARVLSEISLEVLFELSNNIIYFI